MLFSRIAILDENLEYKPKCWVGTKDGTIAYVDTVPPSPSVVQSFGEVYDGQNKLLIPALYNAHTHAPMTLLRGYAENLPLQSWLNDSVWPFEARMTPEDDYWATKLNLAEAARFGVVSISDMYYEGDARVKATVEAGMKINLAESEMFFESKPFSEYALCAKMEDFVARYHGAYDGKVRVDYNIHAEYTSNEQTCRDLAEVAKEKGLAIHVHVSETKKEHEECKARHDGRTPIQYFEHIGVLDVPTLAAHCVWVEDADLEIMQEHKVSVACNPASNMKLASGFAPIHKMLERGINVCLGTDGMASNNNNDMFQEMYLMALVYKGANLDPTLVSPAQVFHAATRAGALAQGRSNCGLLKCGMRADICVLDISEPSWTPLTNPLVNVVYAGHGSDVVLTMCDGVVVYSNGNWPTIDVERAKAEVSTRTKRIIGELEGKA